MARFAFGFANPNHAAALVCAVLPLCWGWRRCAWIGWALGAVLLVALAATQSRTGLFVAGAEIAVWWWILRIGAAVSSRPPYRRWGVWVGLLALAGVVLWWMGPRLALDGSILNRPRIWLAGLQLFVANPNGVGLGNSGTVASAFLLDGIPEIRTMINAHITLLAEFGWIVGWAWFAFIGLALLGVRESPRVGIAFAVLVVSGCSSTVFDWAVLFDFAEQGGLGMVNWVLSWMMFEMFVGFGAWLVVKTAAKGLAALPYGVGSVVVAGVLLVALMLVPTGNAPQVRDGYVIRGETSRTLALYDKTWKLKTVAMRVEGGAVLPVRGMTRFPREMDWSGIDKVMLFGDCREWKHLVKGMTVECVEE